MKKYTTSFIRITLFIVLPMLCVLVVSLIFLFNLIKRLNYSNDLYILIPFILGVLIVVILAIRANISAVITAGITNEYLSLKTLVKSKQIYWKDIKDVVFTDNPYKPIITLILVDTNKKTHITPFISCYDKLYTEIKEKISR